MKIVEKYSHLNGLEFLLVHKQKVWNEIVNVIKNLDSEKCKTKISKEKRMKGKALYSPIELNKNFKKLLSGKGWEESRVSYWVTKNEKLIRKTLTMKVEEQKKEIESCGEQAIFSYNQTDFVKDRIAIEIQIGRASCRERV